jgi:integral membrane sensor domain MASE1
LTETSFRTPRYFVIAAAVAAVYFAAAEVGLSLASVQANVSPVWPPTGIAIAALLLFGRNFWPAILAAALAANLLTPVSFLTAAGIGVGNTLEALTAWFLLRGSGGREKPLDSNGGVLKFIGCAVIISPFVSATIGNVSLCLGGATPWANFPNLWLTWWLGDGFGALVIAPFILSFTDRDRVDSSGRAIAEGSLLLTLLFVTAMVVFGGWLPGRTKSYPIEHLCLPFLVWAALRFDLRILCAAILLLSGIAVWGTSHDRGPFIQASVNESLLLLQLFIGASTVTALVLHAVVTERREREIGTAGARASRAGTGRTGQPAKR